MKTSQKIITIITAFWIIFLIFFIGYWSIYDPAESERVKRLDSLKNEYIETTKKINEQYKKDSLRFENQTP